MARRALPRLLPLAVLAAARLAPASALASAPAPAPPACRNLTGWWCCEPTNLTQSADGATLTSRADYGDGAGTLSGSLVSMLFANSPGALINGTVSGDCASIAWTDGATWARTPAPWAPAVPAPAFAANLSAILELNALAYTSPGGNGSGDGSGTWASLAPKVAHWRGLGVGAIWLAYYNVATAHFYGIRSVYAATDPMTLDASLGSVAEFDAFVEACHGAGIKVFLDVIGHGLVNESKWVASNPEWFAGGSWGMNDYNYSSPGFLAWWATIWLEYALGHGADGYRIDIADEAWWRTGVWDDIAAAARAGGHEIAVWGEGSRYHFGQHDLFAPQTNLTASAADASAAGRCLNTLQWSCHDSGWESGPGNYFFLRGSRAHFAYGALSTFIPLFLGGDEYDEDPVTDLPNLKKDLYGTSGLPGGWMYGSVRDWSQLDDPNGRQALMLADASALLAIQRAHGDVLHRDSCAARVLSLGARVSGAGAPLALDPYARFLDGAKAVLVLASTDAAAAAHVVVDVPLAEMGFGGVAFFEVSTLYGGSPPPPARVSAAALSAYAVDIAADKTPGGGAVVILLVPTQ